MTKNIVWINNGRMCYALAVPAVDLPRQLNAIRSLGFSPWVEA